MGSGTVDLLATILRNRETAQIYGNVLNQDIAAIIQNLFRKFESGKPMKIFNNEIKGISDIDWKNFPNALIISDKEFKCEPILEKLSEIKYMRDFVDE